VPNINLKPEGTINYELGFTKIFSRKTKWENYIYYTQFVDIVETSGDKFNGRDSIIYDGFMCKVVSNQNKGKAYIYGFSSHMTSFLSNYFNLSLMMNYTYGRLKTSGSETPLSQINPFMTRLQVSYTAKKISSDFYINYNGWKRIADYYADPGGEDNQAYATPSGMPAWFTLNLRGSCKLNNYITLQAGIDNLLDTQYRTFASGINAPGRNIFAAIRCKL
jgi:hemoglobin/transferrin/lactoferrin receptor protein